MGCTIVCSENKGADQLRGNCVFVFAYAKIRFSHNAGQYKTAKRCHVTLIRTRISNNICWILSMFLCKCDSIGYQELMHGVQRRIIIFRFVVAI